MNANHMQMLQQHMGTGVSYLKDLTHISLEDTPEISPTVYEGISCFVGVWRSLGYLRGYVGKIINYWSHATRQRQMNMVEEPDVP